MRDIAERLNNRALAGVILTLVGGLLALIPYLERLFTFPGNWVEPMLMGIVSLAALAGVAMALRDMPALGGVVSLVAGILLAVLGPLTAGVLTTVGAAFLFLSAPEVETRPAAQRTDAGSGTSGDPNGPRRPRAFQ